MSFITGQGATTVTATGSTATRSLANRFSDLLNLKDFGAVMDGTTDDSAAWGAAYNAAPTNGGTINIPAGKVQEFGFTTSPAKSVHWNFLGSLDYQTSVPGTNPVSSFGDGDLTTGYYAGRYTFHKFLSQSNNTYATVEISLDNRCSVTQPVAGNVASALVVSSSSTAATANNLYTWNLNCILNTGAIHGGGTQDVNIASAVWKTGSATTWQYFGQTEDRTGTNNGSIVVGEFNTRSNGPEDPRTAYNPGWGSRTGFEFVGDSYQPADWVASTTRAVGDVVTGTLAPGNLYTYVCTVAGTSGTVQPTWPTTSGTVVDGTATWSWGTTIASEISRCINFGGGTNVTYGIGLFPSGKFYSSCIDTSFATLVSSHGSSPAAIRMAANQPIDFSSNQTLAGQNLHTFRYDGTNSRYALANSGTDVFTITGATGTGRLDLTFAAGDNTIHLGTTSNFSLDSTGGGSVYLSSPVVIAHTNLQLRGIQAATSYANDAAAAAGGVAVGQVYHSGSALMIRMA